MTDGDRGPKRVPPKLDYGRPQPRMVTTPMFAQVAAGLLAWVTAVGVVLAVGSATGGQTRYGPIPIWAAICTAVVVLGWSVWKLRVHLGWRGYLPGLLLGLLLTCLVPIGIIAVVCGSWGK